MNEFKVFVRVRKFMLFTYIHVWVVTCIYIVLVYNNYIV